MLIRCEVNGGPDLPKIRMEQMFPITIGRNYYAHGMGLCAGCLAALIITDHGWAEFVPISMFTVIDPTLPKDWFFSNTLDRSEKPWLQAIWGYEKLITDPMHYYRLIDGDSEDVQYLWNREKISRKVQAELDELQELGIRPNEG